MDTNENTTSVEPITCANCGCIIENEDDVITLPDGSIVCCHDCARDLDWVLCEECNEWNLTDDVHEVDGRFLCVDCLDLLGYLECDECHEWYRESRLTYVNGGFHADRNLCNDCRNTLEDDGKIFFCDCCNEWFRSTVPHYYVDDSGDRICEDCYNSHYETCAECGEIFYRDDMHYNIFSEEWFCEDCWDGSAGGTVHDYGYKPNPVFHGLGHWGAPVFGDPLTLGLELEVDKGDDVISSVTDLFDGYDEDTLYCKRDGSLHCGYEIVTHPHTLEAIREELDIPTLIKAPLRYGFKSHDAGTCGLHVHVGRTQLGRTIDDQKQTIAKIALLMYRHAESLVKFSRRSESQLGRWAAMPSFTFNSSTGSPEALTDLVYRYYHFKGRYQALNLENRGTIEFRLWRGSLRADTLMATIQLTHNIVTYAMAHSFKEVALSEWTELLEVETCPELERYTKEIELTAGGGTHFIPFEKLNIDPNQPFKVGDYVQITRGSSMVHSRMVGAIGEIVCFGCIGDEVHAGLRILPASLPIGVAEEHCHSLDGRCPSFDGYWAEIDTLDRLDREMPIPEGSTVICIGRCDNLFGRTGTVISDDGGSYAVAFDGFTGGHNLSGLLREHDGSGWFCNRNEIVALRIA